MRRKLYILAVIALVVAVCVVLVMWRTSRGEKAQLADLRRAAALRGLEQERLGQTLADLQGQIRQLQSQKKAGEQQVRQLQNAVAALTAKRDEDRQVIADLWNLVAAGTRRPKETGAEGLQPVPATDSKKASMPRDESRDRKYGIDAIKQIVAASGGDLGAAVHQIVTPDGMAQTLQEHAGQPAYWAAAASLAPDQETALAFLQEAAQLYPDSPAILSALVSAQMAAGRIDESTLAYANELKRLDPTNALGDCYAAQCQFERGDVPGALQSLAQAGAKGRFSDDRIGMLTTRYEYLVNEGVSEAAALGLSAFTLPLEHLGMIRQLGDQSIEQARAFAAAGQTDEALKIAQDVASVGQTVSSSGRFLVHDRVGIVLQQEGLTEQRQIYAALGDTAKIQEIDSKLQVIGERAATIDTMAQSFGPVMANMTEEDLAAYVDGTILNGEFATLQSIPEIAQALQQAQTPAPQEAAQAIPPEK
jgi:tetratricopeptide (TPR) repeat protein